MSDTFVPDLEDPERERTIEMSFRVRLFGRQRHINQSINTMVRVLALQGFDASDVTSKEVSS